MARQLLLHIGMPKTGTSALQVWFAQNAPALAADGVNYPNAPAKSVRGGITTGNGSKLAQELIALTKFSQKRQRQKLVTALSRHFLELPRVLISSEVLAAMPGDAIDLLAHSCRDLGIEVKVVAYVRHVYDHCYALYQQALKRLALSLTFVEYAAQYENHQLNAVASWQAGFADTLTVCSYDDHKSALIAHFLSTIGVSASIGSPAVRGATVNRGLALSEIELLRVLNPMHRGRLGRTISDAILDADPGRTVSPVFSMEAFKLLDARYSKSLAAFNRAHFGRADGPVCIAHPDAFRWPPLHQPATPDIDQSVVTSLHTLVHRALTTERIYRRVWPDTEGDTSASWKQRWQRRWYRWRYGIRG